MDNFGTSDGRLTLINLYPGGKYSATRNLKFSPEEIAGVIDTSSNH